MTTAVGDEQPQALPTAALAYKRVKFVNKMDDSTGVKGPLDSLDLIEPVMATWRPTLESGWYYLGHGASTYVHYPPGSIPTPPSGVIVRALEDDALRDVASWECVWTDEGAPSNSMDYALWRGVPPNSDYVVIGGILSTSPNFAAPDSSQTNGIKAIRRDLLTMNPTFKVWDDYPSGAREQASVWLALPVIPGLGVEHSGIATGAMIPTLSYNPPPEDIGLNLDPTKVLEIRSSSAAEGDATTSASADA